jgi:hypothetical protein
MAGAHPLHPAGPDFLVARGAVRCVSQMLDRSAWPLPAAPLVVRHRYLIVVPRPFLAEPLVARRRYLIVVPRPTPAAPRRYLIVVPRPMAVAPPIYLIVVPRT